MTLYENTIALDEKTGLPEDYHSFYAAYHPLIMATARRLGIPDQDVLDATQEVATKFWLKNGLDMYDTSKKTQFATLLRNWAGMFMLQERDKVIKAQRYTCMDPMLISVEDKSINASAEDCVLHDTEISAWATGAEQALERANKRYLIPVLRACIDAAETGTAPSRADISQAVGCTVPRATILLQELRRVLTNVGFGMESLYSE